MTQNFEFDPYQALELAYGVSDMEIRTQYRKLVKQYHPDRNTHPNAQDQFDRVVRAYRILSDPEQKRAFDKHREEKIFGGYRPNPQTQAIFDGLKNFASKVAHEYLNNMDDDDEEVDPQIYELCDFGMRSTRSQLKISIAINRSDMQHWKEDPEYWISQLCLLLEQELRSKL